MKMNNTNTTGHAAKTPSGAKILARFDRSLDEELRILWSEYRGKQFLNVRLFWRPDTPTPGKKLPPDGFVATRRGVSIRPGELAALAEAIKQAEKLAEE